MSENPNKNKKRYFYLLLSLSLILLIGYPYKFLTESRKYAEPLPAINLKKCVEDGSSVKFDSAGQVCCSLAEYSFKKKKGKYKAYCGSDESVKLRRKKTLPLRIALNVDSASKKRSVHVFNPKQIKHLAVLNSEDADSNDFNTAAIYFNLGKKFLKLDREGYEINKPEAFADSLALTVPINLSSKKEIILARTINKKVASAQTFAEADEVANPLVSPAPSAQVTLNPNPSPSSGSSAKPLATESSSVVPENSSTPSVQPSTPINIPNPDASPEIDRCSSCKPCEVCIEGQCVSNGYVNCRFSDQVNGETKVFYSCELPSACCGDCLKCGEACNPETRKCEKKEGHPTPITCPDSTCTNDIANCVTRDPSPTVSPGASPEVSPAVSPDVSPAVSPEVSPSTDSCTNKADGESCGVANPIQQVCCSGECVLPCIDTDGGDNWREPGCVMVKNERFCDSCNGNVLQERHCATACQGVITVAPCEQLPDAKACVEQTLSAGNQSILVGSCGVACTDPLKPKFCRISQTCIAENDCCNEEGEMKCSDGTCENLATGKCCTVDDRSFCEELKVCLTNGQMPTLCPGDCEPKCPDCSFECREGKCQETGRVKCAAKGACLSREECCGDFNPCAERCNPNTGIPEDGDSLYPFQCADGTCVKSPEKCAEQCPCGFYYSSINKDCIESEGDFKKTLCSDGSCRYPSECPEACSPTCVTCSQKCNPSLVPSVCEDTGFETCISGSCAPNGNCPEECPEAGCDTCTEVCRLGGRCELNPNFKRCITGSKAGQCVRLKVSCD